MLPVDQLPIDYKLCTANDSACALAQYCVALRTMRAAGQLNRKPSTTTRMSLASARSTARDYMKAGCQEYEVVVEVLEGGDFSDDLKD